MQAGPLRQGMAVLGLLALAPTLLNLALGRLTPGEAAIRALVTFAVVLVAGRVAALALRFYASTVEREQRQRLERRRASDHAD